MRQSRLPKAVLDMCTIEETRKALKMEEEEIKPILF